MNQPRPTTLKPSAYKQAVKRKRPSGPIVLKRRRRRKIISLGWHKARPGWTGRVVDSLDLLFYCLVFMVLWAGMVAYYNFDQDLPSVSGLTHQYNPPGISYFYSKNRHVIAEYAEERRKVIDVRKLPKHVINTFIAAEDANFFKHPGVDVTGVIRAFLKNFEAGRIVQGGSTITQQVTRTFLLTNERSYKRKIREALLAYRLEKNLSKYEILHLYLNQIYLGEGAYGLEEAAETYFNKNAKDLSIAEAAYIAGLVQAPSRLSPFENPGDARDRQLYVLRRMAEARFISREMMVKCANEAVHFSRRNIEPLTASLEFNEYVRRQVIDLVGEKALFRAGIKVFTTVDLELQTAARSAVWKGLSEIGRRHGFDNIHKHLDKNKRDAFLYRQAESFLKAPLRRGRLTEALVLDVDEKNRKLVVQAGREEGTVETAKLAWALKKHPISKAFSPGDVVMVQALEHDGTTGLWSFALEARPDIQASLFCMEPGTGRVLAMVGGRDPEESEFNRAVQARRQPGSSFKPFLYTAAMDTGFTPADVLWDEPVEYYEGPNDYWRPQNYDRVFIGPTTLYEALVKSRNVVAVRLMERVGPDEVIRLAHTMGIKSRLPSYMSLALGSAEVTLSEMVTAYGAFADQGQVTSPIFISRIEDKAGRLLYQAEPDTHRVLTPETAYIMTAMMKGVVERGTATRVKALGRPVAGKTGTTNDLADAWFMGFTPELVTGVWVGRDRRERIGSRESGGHAAAPIFVRYMKEALEGREVHDFPIPENVAFADIDPITGWFAGQDDSFIEEDMIGGEEFVREAVQYVSVAFKKNQVGQGPFSENAPDPMMAGGEGGHVRIVHEDGVFKTYVEPYYPDPGEEVGSWEPNKEDEWDAEVPYDWEDPGFPAEEEVPRSVRKKENNTNEEHIRIIRRDGKYVLIREPLMRKRVREWREKDDGGNNG